MKGIKIFLASSNELKPEREQFEIEIYRKSKAWFDRGTFLHLDIWEDLSARMSQTGSQSEYNKFVKDADLFVLLVWSKLGMYSAEEFETAFGEFKSAKKPFIFTYFKVPPPLDAGDSLAQFKAKLEGLGHFYATFTDSNDLWNQFNKELERLELDGFAENRRNGAGQANTAEITGDKVAVVQGAKDSNININIS
jgi:hypothetical protein